MYNFDDFVREEMKKSRVDLAVLGNEFIRLLRQDLDFERWNFKLSYKEFTGSYLEAVFDSEWCRVEFTSSIDGNTGWNTFRSYYGRLHAPNKEAEVFFNGERCTCWHSLRWNVIRFLDGMTPGEAFKARGQVPEKVDRFMESEKIAAMKYNPELTLLIENYIWSEYTPALFRIFDLRDQSLWKKFYEFNKEYYRLANIPNIPGLNFPTEDKIC